MGTLTRNGLNQFCEMFQFHRSYKRQKKQGFLLFTGYKMETLPRNGLNYKEKTKNWQQQKTHKVITQTVKADLVQMKNI